MKKQQGGGEGAKRHTRPKEPDRDDGFNCFPVSQTDESCIIFVAFFTEVKNCAVNCCVSATARLFAVPYSAPARALCCLISIILLVYSD